MTCVGGNLTSKMEKLPTFTSTAITTIAKSKVFKGKRGNGYIDGQLHKENSFSCVIPSYKVAYEWPYTNWHCR